MSSAERRDGLEQDKNHELLLLRDTAIEAALSSGRIIWSYYDGHPVDNSLIEWKPDETPKTMADVAGDFRIVEILRDRFPHDDILIEESGYHKALDLHRGEEAERIWYADSLDGSRPFIEGKPEFTTGVQVNDRKTGEYLAGAIVHPGRRQLLYAARGQGSYLVKLDEHLRPIGEPKRISVSNKTTLNGATIAIDSLFRTTNGDIKDEARRVLRAMATGMAQQEGKILNLSFDEFGSNIAYEADVARGATLLGITDCLGGIWDVKGGGEAVITEAGGVVIDLLTGQPVSLNTDVVIYGNEQIVKLVQPELAKAYRDYQGFDPQAKRVK